MKTLIISCMLFIGCNCFGQKIKNKVYANVDTIRIYENAEVIIYKNKYGKEKEDTIWMKGKSFDVDIKKANQVELYNGEKLKRK